MQIHFLELVENESHVGHQHIFRELAGRRGSDAEILPFSTAADFNRSCASLSIHAAELDPLFSEPCKRGPYVTSAFAWKEELIDTALCDDRKITSVAINELAYQAKTIPL